MCVLVCVCVCLCVCVFVCVWLFGYSVIRSFGRSLVRSFDCLFFCVPLCCVSLGVCHRRRVRLCDCFWARGLRVDVATALCRTAAYPSLRETIDPLPVPSSPLPGCGPSDFPRHCSPPVVLVQTDAADGTQPSVAPCVRGVFEKALWKE